MSGHNYKKLGDIADEILHRMGLQRICRKLNNCEFEEAEKLRKQLNLEWFEIFGLDEQEVA